MTSPSFARRLFASLASALATGLAVFAVVFLAYYVAAGAVIANVVGFVQAFGPSAVVPSFCSSRRLWLADSPTCGERCSVASLSGSSPPTSAPWCCLCCAGPSSRQHRTTRSGTCSSYNLIFVLLTILAALTVGRRVYTWAFGLRLVAPPRVHRLALVRAPATTLAKGQVTHVKRRVVKFDKAEQQWDAYVAALEAEGFTTLQIDADESHPDCVFIEDTVVMLGQVAVITSPGADSRTGEQDAVEAVIADLGLETRHIRQPGTLDGGDVLKIGDDRLRRPGRANKRRGHPPVPRYRSRVGIHRHRRPGHEGAAPEERGHRAAGWHGAWSSDARRRPPGLSDLPRGSGGRGVAVVVLTSNAVLMSASAPKTVALIESLGYRVTTVEIGEFEKLEGCVTCLSVRIR